MMQGQDRKAAVSRSAHNSKRTDLLSSLKTGQKPSEGSNRGASLQELGQQTPGGGSHICYSLAVPDTEPDVLEIEIDLGLEEQPSYLPAQSPMSLQEAKDEEGQQALDNVQSIERAVTCHDTFQQTIGTSAQAAGSMIRSHAGARAHPENSQAATSQDRSASAGDSSGKATAHQEAQQQRVPDLPELRESPDELGKPSCHEHFEQKQLFANSAALEEESPSSGLNTAAVAIAVSRAASALQASPALQSVGLSKASHCIAPQAASQQVRGSY